MSALHYGQLKIVWKIEWFEVYVLKWRTPIKYRRMPIKKWHMPKWGVRIFWACNLGVHLYGRGVCSFGPVWAPTLSIMLELVQGLLLGSLQKLFLIENVLLSLGLEILYISSYKMGCLQYMYKLIGIFFKTRIFHYWKHIYFIYTNLKSGSVI